VQVQKLFLAAAGILALTASAVSIMRAQPTPATAPAFEVVSVKPLDPADRPSFQPPTASAGGRFVSKFYLAFVIAWAYKLPFNSSPRLSGVPDWVRSATYDIEATGVIPSGLSAQAREDRMRLMVRSLLADRFHLAIHRETKTMPVYALVVGKSGPKLQPADISEKDCPDVSAIPTAPVVAAPDTCHTFNGGQGRGLHARAVNMADLASYVENWTGRPLLDKTGIKGLYRIETRGWLSMQLMTQPLPPGAKAEDGSDMADLPTLFQIFEQLGLKMEARNDKADIYVVDHIEKPSEN